MKQHFTALLFLILSASLGCQEKKNPAMANTQSYAIRLKPGEDLKSSIQKFVVENKINAGWVASCVGSLTQYNIRFANQPTGSTGQGHFEILNLSGTLSDKGSHLDIAVSDSTGKTMGGHLMEECIVYTTAEIIIQSTDEFTFSREKDGTTEWEELQIKQKK